MMGNNKRDTNKRMPIEIAMNPNGQTLPSSKEEREVKHQGRRAILPAIYVCVVGNALVGTPNGIKRIKTLNDSGLVNTPDGVHEYMILRKQ